MRFLLTSFAVLAAATAAVIEDRPAKRQGGTPCASLKPPAIDGATVVSSTGMATSGACQVTVVLTHGDAKDKVNTVIGLPDSNRWNGRFQGTGGGGMSAGSGAGGVQGPVSQGYAAGSTDAGLPNSFDGSAWASNDELLKNFAHRSIHEMTVIGKALAEQFYGTAVKFSYWNGCSTGGRQGYMEAQRYPTDYNGIYAASPAINWDRFHVAMIWPYIVQNTEGEFVPQRVFDALTAAVVKACDLNDGGADGVVVDPTKCEWDSSKAVGSTATAKQVAIFEKIRQGPVDAAGNRLWSGIVAGASYSSLAGSSPFTLSSSWIKNFVLKQPSLDLKTLTYASFVDIFNKAHTTYDDLIGTDNPDMSAFKKAGGKLLSWHGWADQLIFANGTVNYHARVQDAMGGPVAVDGFYRLFMVPGVQHCAGGNGAAPSDPFGALINWVEKGQARDMLAASGGIGKRNLCRYPTALKYKGEGDLKAAESWTCA